MLYCTCLCRCDVCTADLPRIGMCNHHDFDSLDLLLLLCKTLLHQGSLQITVFSLYTPIEACPLCPSFVCLLPPMYHDKNAEFWKSPKLARIFFLVTLIRDKFQGQKVKGQDHKTNDRFLADHTNLTVALMLQCCVRLSSTALSLT